MLTVYTKPICPYCIKAKHLLAELGIPYTEIDISDNPDMIVSLAQTSGMRTVPQVFFGEECLGGYTDILRLHEAGRLLSRVGLVHR